MSESVRAMKARIIPLLVELDWTLGLGAALVTKQFPTAVGPKLGLVYLQDYGPNSGGFLLAGDYQSEGRNQMESHGYLIPHEVSDGRLREIIVKFSTGMDKVVSHTYAARLLADRPKD